MSTSQNDDETSRPQPRYGAYASPAEPDSASDPGPEEAAPYNPYAQPTWGQPGGGAPDTGQPSYQNPYGAPYDTQQQGQYPQQSYHPAPQQRPKRPATLWTVLAALITAGVTSLIWGIYVLVTLPAQSMSDVFGGAFGDTFVEEMERQVQQDPALEDFSAQELEEATLAMMGLMALIWAAVLLALYIGAAFLGSMAGNPGRIIATIWAVLSLLFFTLGHDGASYGLISVTVVCSIVAIVMMWLPASNQYIRFRRWEKETLRGGYRQP